MFAPPGIKFLLHPFANLLCTWPLWGEMSMLGGRAWGVFVVALACYTRGGSTHMAEMMGVIQGLSGASSLGQGEPLVLPSRWAGEGGGAAECGISGHRWSVPYPGTMQLRGGGRAGGCKAKHLSTAKEGRRIMVGKHAFPGLALGGKQNLEDEEAAAKSAITVAGEEAMRDAAEVASDEKEIESSEEDDSFPSYSSEEPAQAVAEMKKRVQSSRELAPPGGEIPLTAMGKKMYGAIELAQSYQGRPIKIMRHPRPKEQGNIWAWGCNYDGQLGIGQGCKMDRSAPMRHMFLPPGPVCAIAAGAHHSLVLRDDGIVLAFGMNEYGQLGDGSTDEAREPVKVSGLPGQAKSVAAGRWHSLAVLKDGSIYAWGRKSEGQLGNKDAAAPGVCNEQVDTDVETPSISKRSRAWRRKATKRSMVLPTPVDVSLLHGSAATQAAAGGCFSLALDSAGAVWYWGTARGLEVREVPCRVPGMSTDEGMFTAIAAGKEHGLALDRNGGVWQFGGDAAAAQGGNAVKIQGIGKVVSIAAGGGASVVLEEGGRIVWWGRVGEYSSETATAVGGLPGWGHEQEGQDIVDVATTGDCIAALARDGSVYAWGSNFRGQCGAGEKYAGKNVVSPRKVKGMGGCKALAAGGAHFLALERVNA